MRILNIVLYDLKFQFKYGFYFAYLFVGIFYIAILRFLPVGFQNPAAQFIIYTDTSLLGFMFIGGIILLEKSQNTLEFLFVTPMKISEYIISKLISLTFMALLISFLIIFSGYGFNINYLSFISGIVLNSILITELGIIVGAHSKTINHYLINFIFTFPLFVIPLLDLLNIIDNPVFYILPTQCTFKLIESGFSNTLNIKQILLISVYLIITVFLLYKLTYKHFYKNIVLKAGDE